MIFSSGLIHFVRNDVAIFNSLKMRRHCDEGGTTEEAISASPRAQPRGLLLFCAPDRRPLRSG